MIIIALAALTSTLLAFTYAVKRPNLLSASLAAGTAISDCVFLLANL